MDAVEKQGVGVGIAATVQYGVRMDAIHTTLPRYDTMRIRGSGPIVTLDACVRRSR